MATLKDYFTTDFGRWMIVTQDHTATVSPTMEKITFPVRVHEDMTANAKFVSMYVPDAIHPIGLARVFADDIELAL